jgi:hypothetical protein
LSRTIGRLIGEREGLRHRCRTGSPPAPPSMETTEESVIDGFELVQVARRALHLETGRTEVNRSERQLKIKFLLPPAVNLVTHQWLLDCEHSLPRLQHAPDTFKMI